MGQQPVPHHTRQGTVAHWRSQDVRAGLHEHIRNGCTGQVAVRREEEHIIKPCGLSVPKRNHIVRIGQGLVTCRHRGGIAQDLAFHDPNRLGRRARIIWRDGGQQRRRHIALPGQTASARTPRDGNSQGAGPDTRNGITYHPRQRGPLDGDLQSLRRIHQPVEVRRFEHHAAVDYQRGVENPVRQKQATVPEIECG